MHEQDPLPGQHPHRGIFASLVVAIILLVAIFGFFLYSAFFATDESREAELESMIDVMEDQMEGMQDIIDNGQNEDDEAEVETETTATFNQYSDMLPTFDYMTGWHVSVQDSHMNDALRRVVHVSETPIYFCDACDGPRTPIVISAVDATVGLTGNATLEAYVEDKNSGPMYSDVVIKKISDAQFEVTGHVDGLYEVDYEVIYFLSGNNLVTVYFGHSDEPTTTTLAGWELLTSTLDFSAIE